MSCKSKKEEVVVIKGQRGDKDVPWLHVVRVIACLLVVCVHTIPPYDEFLCEGRDAVFRDILSLFTKPCVPLFFMITGFLILPYKGGDFLDLYRKRIPRVLYPLLFWGCVYAILPWLLNMYDMDIMLKELLLSPVKSPGRIGGILWYLFMLIGIYLIIPFVNPAIYESKRMMIAYLMLWFVTSLTIILQKYTHNWDLVLGYNSWRHHFDMTIYFSGYLGFLLLGTAIKLGMLPARILGGGKLNLIIIYLIVYLISYKYGLLSWSFLAFGTVVMTLCIFLLVKDMDINEDGLFYSTIKSVSKYSFGIYLSHMVVFRCLTVQLYYQIGTFWYIQLLTPVLTIIGAYFLVRIVCLLPISKYLVG